MRITTIQDIKDLISLYPHVKRAHIAEYPQFIEVRIRLKFWYWLFFGWEFEKKIKSVVEYGKPYKVIVNINIYF